MHRHAGTGFLAAVFVAAMVAGAGCKGPGAAEAIPAAQEPGTTDPGVAAPAGRIACDTPAHDYGTVTVGQPVKHTFTVKNVGDGVLHILSARGG